MSRIALLFAFAVTAAACASSRAPTLAVDGYVRVPTPVGCYKHVSARDRNIELWPDFETHVLELLGYDGSADLRCWHERPDGNLLVALGSECGTHRTAEFQRVASTWALKNTQDVPIVLCDERRR